MEQMAYSIQLKVLLVWQAPLDNSNFDDDSYPCDVRIPNSSKSITTIRNCRRSGISMKSRIEDLNAGKKNYRQSEQ